VIAALRRYGSLVRVSHTVFALPFAIAAVVLAAPYGEVTGVRVALVVICIVAARTAAMAFNRLVDRRFDAANPRTREREIPTGTVSVAGATALTVVSGAVFVAGAAALGTTTLALAPIALALVLGYSYTKRFTALCHVILGAAVALAPGGAWIAMSAPVTAAPWLLVGAVATWVAGFDITYALADREFDRASGLRSIPAVMGESGARFVSAGLHIATVAALVGVGMLLDRGVAYFVGCAAVAGLLAVEHWGEGVAERKGEARGAWVWGNAGVSVGFLAVVFLDAWIGGAS
jgi:4-hydroxybenzoate polyprenyltransferase